MLSLYRKIPASIWVALLVAATSLGALAKQASAAGSVPPGASSCAGDSHECDREAPCDRESSSSEESREGDLEDLDPALPRPRIRWLREARWYAPHHQLRLSDGVLDVLTAPPNSAA